MSEEENKALVRRWNEEGAIRPDDYDEYLHQAYTVYGGSEGRWPAYASRETMEVGWREYLEHHPTVTTVVDDIIAEGDKVAIRATRMEEGRPAANIMVFYRVADGKIVDDWVCYNEIEQ